MESLKGIPVVGQGAPLPPNFPYEGQWLHEGVLFLFRGRESARPDAPEMTVSVPLDAERWCAGINAAQIAKALGTDSDTIFEHNAAGTLFLVRTDEMPGSRGGIVALRYIFQIGEIQGAIVIESGFQAGTA